MRQDFEEMQRVNKKVQSRVFELRLEADCDSDQTSDFSETDEGLVHVVSHQESNLINK